MSGDPFRRRADRARAVPLEAVLLRAVRSATGMTAPNGTPNKARLRSRARSSSTGRATAVAAEPSTW